MDKGKGGVHKYENDMDVICASSLAPGGGRGAVVGVVRVQRTEGGRGVGEPVTVVVVRPEKEDG